MLFDKQIILFDQEMANQERALTTLAQKLETAGLVTKDFSTAIIQREHQFPTGLLTQTMGVAIPHTDADKVIEPQIAFMRLKKPVIFHQMGDNQEIAVQMIFMLALKQGQDQLKMLQKLMALFQDASAMHHLITIRSSEELITLLQAAQII